jgi:hypothetical protein
MHAPVCTLCRSYAVYVPAQGLQTKWIHLMHFIQIGIFYIVIRNNTKCYYAISRHTFSKGFYFTVIIAIVGNNINI